MPSGIDPRILVSRTYIALCGGADSPSMEAAVMAWLIQENGPSPVITRNNPWNLHSSGGLPGQIGTVYVGPGDTNVAVFRTVQDGVAACVANLKAHGYDFAHYDAVLAAVKAGDALGFLDALARSAWSAGHYGGPGASNQLIAIYRRLTAATPTGGTTVTDPVLTPIVAAIKSILGSVEVYTSHAGPLDAKQAAALATDARTLVIDAQRLVAALGGPVAAAPVAAPVPDASLAPIVPVDLSANSHDTVTYIQQAFAIEAGQKYTGVWPSEITTPAWRRRFLIQETAALLGAGPRYTPKPLLTCAQVHAAAQWMAADPGLNVNPIYAEALTRGDLIATDGTGYLPWAGMDTTLSVIDAGSFGQTPVSGWYGTGSGPQPA